MTACVELTRKLRLTDQFVKNHGIDESLWSKTKLTGKCPNGCCEKISAEEAENIINSPGS